MEKLQHPIFHRVYELEQENGQLKRMLEDLRRENRRFQFKQNRTPYVNIKCCVQRHRRKKQMEEYLNECIKNIPYVEECEILLRLTGGVNLKFIVNRENAVLNDQKPEHEKSKLIIFMQVKDQFQFSDVAAHEIHMIILHYSHPYNPNLPNRPGKILLGNVCRTKQKTYIHPQFNKS